MANGAAAHRGHVTIGSLGAEIVVGSGIDHTHFFPICFEFFCNHHGRRSHTALAHFGTCVPNHNGVVGFNFNPHIELRCVGSLGALGHEKPQGKACTGCARNFKEVSTVHASFVILLRSRLLGRVHARAPFLATE